MKTLEFFFDCGSPWTYLAFHKIEELCEQTGADLVWKPILVGGVFNQVNQEVYAARAEPNPLRIRYHAKDLKDWADLYGLNISWPSVFPVNSVKAMRGAFVALDAGCLPAFAREVFDQYWGEGQDISQDEVMLRIAGKVGLGGDFLERIASQPIKDRLRANTQELIDRGGFGSPTLFVAGDDMFFGNDRLPLVRAALERPS